MQSILKVRLKNNESQELLTQEYGGTRDDKMNADVWPRDANLEAADGRHWYMIPAVPEDHNRLYYIVNAQSGKGLLQEYAGTRDDKNNAMVWPLSERDNLQNKNGFLWSVSSPVENGNASASLTTIVSKQLLIQEYSGTRGDKKNVHVWPVNGHVDSQAGTKWTVEIIERIPMPPVPASQSMTPTQIQQKVADQLQQHNSLPDKIELGVTEVQPLSGIFVKDSIPIADKLTTYYRLEKESEWYRADGGDNLSPGSGSITASYTKGWSRSEQESLSVTMGYSVSAGDPAVASVTFSLSITAGYSVTDSTSGGEQTTITLDLQPHHRGGIYIKRDKLILRNSRGEELQRWNLNTANTNYFVLV